MTKAKLLALFLAGAASGAVAPRLLSGGATPRALEFQSAQLYLTRGTTKAVAFRACGYLSELQRDGGVRRIGEPCWSGQLPEGDVTTIATKMLSAYDGGTL